MTQVWENGDVLAVTRVQAGPCTVTQIKDSKTDGYSALQLGFGVRKEKNLKKPQKGHLKKLGNFQYLREFRAKSDEELAGASVGSVITAAAFAKGDKANVVGISKGKGFQGVVKRHGFSGSKMTHGNKDQQRMPGSIGATGPAHVFKGTRMGGRTGGEQVTVLNQEIVGVDPEENIILIKGNVPGARNSLVLIKSEGDLKFEEAVKTDEKKTDIAEVKEPSAKEKKESGQEQVKSSDAAPAGAKEETGKKEENIEQVVEEAKEKKDKENKS